MIAFFLLINSIAIFRKKDIKYFFIRFLFLLISIIFIPQIFLFFGWNYEYIDQIKSWGEISYILFNLHQIEWVSYIISLIGIISFLLTQNFFVFLKFPKLNFQSFTNTKIKIPKEIRIKKEPVIKNNANFDDQEKYNTNFASENSI